MGISELFSGPAEAFTALVEQIPADTDWQRPALGAWDLRSLVGHTSRALITVDTYLDRPAAVEALRSPEATSPPARQLPPPTRRPWPNADGKPASPSATSPRLRSGPWSSGSSPEPRRSATR